MKTRKDKDMISRTSTFYVENDTKLSWLIELGVVYDKNQTGQQHDQLYKCDLCFHDTELLWPIGSSVIIDENQIGQLCDWSYKCSLHWKWNSVDMPDRIGYGFYQN